MQSDSLLNDAQARIVFDVQADAHVRLGLLERICLMLGIVEITLQIDKYLMFHEQDALLGAVGGFNVSVTTISIFALYWFWITKAVASRSNQFEGFDFGIPMLFYIAAVAISLLSATLPILGLFDLFLLSQAFLLFVYIANRIRHSDDLIYCFTCLATTVLLQSFFIVGLYAMGDAAYGQYFEIGPLVLSVWDDGRPAGSMQSAVLAGSTMALMWLPSSSLLFVDGLSRGSRLIFAASAVFGLLAIMLTQTRGAIISSVVGAGILCFGLRLRNWLPKWTSAMALFLCLICAFPLYVVVKNRIQGGDSGSAKARLHLSAIALELIEERPFTGYGAGNCHIAGQRFADQVRYRAEWYYTIHCKYLLAWIETGLIGLTAFLLVLGKGFRDGWLAWTSFDRKIGRASCRERV